MPRVVINTACLRKCVWSWWDPGLSSKLADALVAHHMGQSQAETGLYSPHSTLWENITISNYLDVGWKYIRISPPDVKKKGVMWPVW